MVKFSFFDKSEKERTKTKYYITYVAENSGFGATEIVTDEPVIDISSISKWAGLIEDSLGERVTIILWRKYS